MELIIGIITGLLILVFLIVVHELGHAIVARRNGVVVEEFGIGFPPRAWKRKLKNGILFTINWLPLGGFVKLQGEYDAADKKGDYGAASFFKKTKIILAGVVINWLVAAVLLSILALVGLPKILPNQVTVTNDSQIISEPVQIVSVGEDSPAETAGLQSGDKVLVFDSQNVETVEQLVDLAAERAGEEVTVAYERDGAESTTRVTLREDGEEGFLGAGLGQRESIRATWSAPLVGIATTAQFTAVTLQGLGELLTNLVGGLVMQLSPDPATREQASTDLATAGDSVAGPIGILGVLFPAAQQAGLVQLTFLTAIISMTLAVINVLPIPALDGGRWLIMAIYRAMKKELTKEREEKIQMVGFTALVGLIILVTIADVGKLF